MVVSGFVVDEFVEGVFVGVDFVGDFFKVGYCVCDFDVVFGDEGIEFLEEIVFVVFVWFEGVVDLAEGVFDFLIEVVEIVDDLVEVGCVFCFEIVVGGDGVGFGFVEVE